MILFFSCFLARNEIFSLLLQPISDIMNNFAKRVITGLTLVAITITLLVISQYGVLIVGVVVSTLSLWEFLSLASINAPQYTWTAMAICAVAWGIMVFGGNYGQIAFLAVPLISFIHLADAKNTDIFNAWGKMSLGFLYCLVPMMLFYQFSFVNGAYNWRIPLGIIVINGWMDTMAYFAGKYFGKHPMSLRLSPKKTWEGFAGGFVATWIAGIVCHFTLTDAGINWLIITAIISIFNQPADLVESMLKRSVHIKDSGGLLPGHGGMLDRCDSYFILFPIIYVYLSLAQILAN